jgi:hypothetical protein
MKIGNIFFSPEIIQRINETISNEPAISRRKLSLQVCEWLNWRAPNGKYQEMSCRKALRKLHDSRHITLPIITEQYSFQKPSIKNTNSLKNAFKPVHIHALLEELGKVEILLIQSRFSEESHIWKYIMKEFHPLSNGPLCGRQLRYLVHSDIHGWLGGLSFSAATWHLKARDEWIGWSDAAHRVHINEVVCNSRFLILPTIEVPNLASHILSKSISRLPGDWKEQYGYEPVLVETFVNSALYSGTCYQAANWQKIGQSAARSTPHPNGKISEGKKDIYVYALKADWKETLCKEPEQKLCAKPRPISEDWIEEELGRVDFYDDRLILRLHTLVEDFFKQVGTSVPQLCNGSGTKMKGAYRFFSNPKINMETILKSHTEATIERVRENKVVLAVQDTTSLNYTTHPKTKGLGPIMESRRESLGFLLHGTMAFTPQGIPLGLLDARCWTRNPDEIGKGKQRHQLPIEEKESMKWLESYRAVSKVQEICPDTMLVSVCDREADIYEFFMEACKNTDGPEILVRAERTRNRQSEEGKLWEVMAGKPIAGHLEIIIPKKNECPARTAKLAIRFSKIKLKPPQGKELEPIEIFCVYGFEVDYAADVDSPIEWLLLTTVSTTTFEQACERMDWYAKRWGIEVYHRILKSGCRTEERRLGDSGRLKVCLSIDLIIAWRLYFLMMKGRKTPNISCDNFFSEDEWKVLCMVMKKKLKRRRV